MRSIIIEDIKKFMSDLLVGNEFDNFLVSEVSITTTNTFTIDGHINKNFFSPEELEERKDKELSFWSEIKPVCYELIKGKKTPWKFKIVFMKRIEDNEQIDGLFINVKFENNVLTCITGSSMKSFSMDKTFENEWDEQVESHLKKY